MFKQSPSRTQRSKGFKTKHGLQIFLLIAICFWLLYQVKHSHDKRKAFVESSMKLSSKLDEEHENADVRRIGRKGLPEKVPGDDLSHKEEVMEGDEEDDKPEEEEEEEEIKPEEEEGEKDSKQEEEETEKSKHEEDEEINKDEEEETEEEENKSEDNEEERRGAGDDEIDEQDQVRDEEETDNDVVDEQEKGVKEDTEEGEIRAKLEQMDNAGSSEDQDHDRNTQEAREENYKRDDVSSAVVREPHLEITESERVNLNVNVKEQEETREMNKKLELEKTNATTSGEDNKDQKGILDENVENNSSVMLKTDEEMGINGSQISAIISNPDKVLEVGNSSTGEQNRTYMDSGSVQDLKHDVVTSSHGGSNLESFNKTENSNITSGSDLDTALPNTVKNEEADIGKVSDASNNTETLALGGQAGTSGSAAQNNSVPSAANENNHGTQSEGIKTTDDGTEEADGGKASLATNGNTDVIQSETDVTNSKIITEEEREARIDLGTLPDTETKGSDKEDAAL